MRRDGHVFDRAKWYVKKPVKIRAIELDETCWIETREGKLKGYKGDFLIEGIEGEIYPCGREIFFKTYELYEGTEIYITPKSKQEKQK